MQFKMIPVPENLKAYVECIRVASYHGEANLAINVCLNGLPGIVFQHHQGHSPVENITTSAGNVEGIPTLYIYGQMTQPGVMNHKKAPFTSTQIVLKPHALHTLMGVNASVLTNSVVDLAEFGADTLNLALLDTPTEQEQIKLLTNYLLKKLTQGQPRDCLVEESLRLIHKNSGFITVKDLLHHLNLSERQFEKRFSQTVGLSPQFYIRVKRFNQAIRLMQTQQFDKLTDVAHALNFYDQSHFIRDIKAFSGITPKNLSQKVDYFQADQGIYAYMNATVLYNS